MIVETVFKDDFVQRFLNSPTYDKQFSYEALEALYEYLSDIYEGEIYNFDYIGIACDYSEYGTMAEMLTEYGLSLTDDINDYTQTIAVGNTGRIIAQNF